MKHTKERTIKKLKELQAPEILINLAKGEKAPDELKSEFQTPYEFYELTSEVPGNMPFEDQLVPLWETTGECITAYVEQEPPMVIRYYYEDPKSKYKILGKNILDAIKNFLEFLYFEVGVPQRDIFEAAKSCNLTNIETFSEILKD